MLFYTGGEVVTDLYTSNVAPLYLQDVSCNGTESFYTECTASTELDSDCMDPSRAVGVRCYFECMYMTMASNVLS